MSLNLNKRDQTVQNIAVIDQTSLSLLSLVHGKVPKVLHRQIKTDNNEKNLAKLLKTYKQMNEIPQGKQCFDCLCGQYKHFSIC